MATPARDEVVFDADNHYYEALDAFTRHLDPALGPRAVQWAEIGGRRYHVVAGRVSHAVSNPTFDPISKPGCLYDYLRGNPEGANPLELLRQREPIPDHYRRPEARLAVMDAQGLEAMWLFPTLGVLYEELLLPDVDAVTATFTAFNRWLDEDWDRVIFGSDWPHIEGLPEPRDYLKAVEPFPPDVQRRILHDNAHELNELQPSA